MMDLVSFCLGFFLGETTLSLLFLVDFFTFVEIETTAEEELALLALLFLVDETEELVDPRAGVGFELRMSLTPS